MTEICSSVDCCGCEVCANTCPQQCISFVADNEGFFVPVIDSAKCVDCKLCQKVCPANSEPKYNAPQESVYAAWALEDKIRQSSSSGGLYSIFANYCFSQGGVANGVIFNDDLLAIHELFDSADKIIPCRGSKYVQSKPGNIYKRIKKELQNDRMVFFASTPCQVNALYKFLGKDYENLYTCDFVCHGVPSPLFLRDCIHKMIPDNSAVTDISFRDLTGWGRYNLNVKSDGKIYNEKLINNVYIKTFLAGANCRFNCYHCPFTKGARVADITIGDFWGLGKYKPFMHNTSKGVSLLMVNSKKGEALLDKVKDQLFLEKRSFREAARDNHQLRENVAMPVRRCDFYMDIRSLSPLEVIKKYKRRTPLWKKLLNFPLRVFFKIIRLGVNALKDKLICIVHEI